MKQTDADIVVIGAGPVGLFCIFECGMLRFKCHVVDTLAEVGGQCTALYPEKPIYDIPGFPKIVAKDLIQNLCEQAQPFQPVFYMSQHITSLRQDADGFHWIVTSEKGLELKAKAVILAVGGGAFGPNRPPLENLEQYEEKSVFYYVKNKEKFAGKRVVIAGGGDSAVDWALELQDIAKRVTVVHRRDKFRAAPENVERLRALVENGDIDWMIPFQLHGLEGREGDLSHVVVRHMNTGEAQRIPTDALLSFFGLSSDLGPVREWGLQHEHPHIRVTPGTCETNLPGIFAVGDVATYPHKLNKLILTGFVEAAGVARAIQKRIFPDQHFHFEHSTTSGVPSL